MYSHDEETSPQESYIYNIIKTKDTDNLQTQISRRHH